MHISFFFGGILEKTQGVHNFSLTHLPAPVIDSKLIVKDESTGKLSLAFKKIGQYDWKRCLSPETLHLYLSIPENLMKLDEAVLRKSLRLTDTMLQLKHSFWYLYDRWVSGARFGSKAGRYSINSKDKADLPERYAPSMSDMCRGVCEPSFFMSLRKNPAFLAWFFKRDAEFKTALRALQGVLVKKLYRLAELDFEYTNEKGVRKIDKSLAQLQFNTLKYITAVDSQQQVEHRHLHMVQKGEFDDPVKASVDGLNVLDVETMKSDVKRLNKDSASIDKLLRSNRDEE